MIIRHCLISICSHILEGRHQTDKLPVLTAVLQICLIAESCVPCPGAETEDHIRPLITVAREGGGGVQQVTSEGDRW